MTCPITQRCDVKAREWCCKDVASCVRRSVCSWKAKGKTQQRSEMKRFCVKWRFYATSRAIVNVQGRGRVISDMYSTVTAFKTKLSLWETQIRKQNLSHLPSCQIMKEKLSTAVFPSAQFVEKLNILAANFRHQFADFEAQKIRFELLSNPFGVDMESALPNLQIELIELQCNDTLRKNMRELVLLSLHVSSPTKCPSCASKLLRRSLCLAAHTCVNNCSLWWT